MTKVDALSIALQVMEQYTNDEEVEQAVEVLLKMKDRIIHDNNRARRQKALRNRRVVSILGDYLKEE